MDEQIKLLISKALDALRICENRNIPKFVGFLSPGEAAAVACATTIKKNVTFFGGYEDAERRFFGALPEYLEDDLCCFPIKALKISFNGNFSLTHRDVLGAFMSTGVSRATVGDILIFDSEVFVFVFDEMAEYFKNQINKIKNVGVSITVLESLSDVPERNADEMEEFKFTVSSPRLDAVVSKLIGQSRTVSEKLIAACAEVLD